MPTRGNIDSLQIKAADRQGTASLIQMYSGSAPVSGHSAAFDANGNLIDGGNPSAGAVASVFGRTGAVTAQAGDYTAAQVTNAVSSISTYADPAWLTSLAYSKLTGAPTVAGTVNYIPVFTSANGIGNSVIYQSGSYVGIGNTAPNRLLEVGSGIANTLPASVNFAALNTIAASGTSAKTLVMSAAGALFPGATELVSYDYAGSAFIPLHINASQILMGDSNRGNAQVAIGPAGVTTTARVTISDTSSLALRLYGSYGGSIANNTALVFHGAAAAADLWAIGSDIYAGTGSQDFHFQNNGGSTLGVTMTLQRAGRVGIGETAPPVPLTVANHGYFDAIPTLGTASGKVFIEADGLNYGLFMGVTASGPCWLQEMRMDGTGNAYSILLNPSGGPVGINVPACNHQFQLGFDDAAKTATSTWVVTSDARLKRNIRDFAGGLDVIRKLHLIEAEYNGLGGLPEGLRVTGFLADELRAIVPHAVGSTRGKLRPTDAEETDILDMNLHEVLMHLILAVQQLNQRMEKN
jgi:hypothetical protein